MNAKRSPIGRGEEKVVECDITSLPFQLIKSEDALYFIEKMQSILWLVPALSSQPPALTKYQLTWHSIWPGKIYT